MEDGGWDDVVLCTGSLSAPVALVGGEGNGARPDIIGEMLLMVFVLERQTEKGSKGKFSRNTVDVQVPLEGWSVVASSVRGEIRYGSKGGRETSEEKSYTTSKHQLNLSIKYPCLE